MIEEIAKKVKETRDSSFIPKEKIADGSEMIVNRTEKIASIGGSGLDNEEAYLWANWRAPWEWSISKPRPVSDTPLRWQVCHQHLAGVL